ncbi:MAG: cyclic nucleotide-binding domain-containing protein [Acidimicrobiia bacterium]
MSDERVAPIPLFRGLHPDVVQELIETVPTRSFAPGEYLCREGEPGSSLFIIQRGLAHVTVGPAGVNVGRLRRGDVIGEMSMLTGEPRTASVVATVDTVALELDQATFAQTLSRHPELLANLTRILSERLARTTQSHSKQPGRGEALTLVVGAGLDGLADDVIEMVGATSPGATAAVDLRERDGPVVDGLERTLAALDDLLAVSATVTVTVPAAFLDLPLLTMQTDRTVILARADEAAAIVAGLVDTPTVEVAVVDGEPVSSIGRAPVIRSVRSADRRRDAGWLGRHVSRTKLGLALGAGGAKGYAHIGAVRVLEEAGYEIDYVSGSSIGAVVGVCLGFGMTSHEVERTLRDIFTPEQVNEMFTLSFAGTSAGADAMHGSLEALTGGRTFADLTIPVTAMTVDLDAKTAHPIDDGSLLDALSAATALAGFVPPFTCGDRRLIDAVAMVPVPSDAVRSAGADVTVSVNLMSRRTRPAWPGQAAPESTKKRERMLDVLLQVMDLAQIDSSVRHAAAADVVLTPWFGPATWRDFDLADLFLEAGREVAVEQLPALGDLARPPL